MQTQFSHMNSAIKYFWLCLLQLLLPQLLLLQLLLHATRNIIKFSYSIDCSRAQRKCNLQLGTKCKYYSYATLSAKYAKPVSRGCTGEAGGEGAELALAEIALGITIRALII